MGDELYLQVMGGPANLHKEGEDQPYYTLIEGDVGGTFPFCAFPVQFGGLSGLGCALINYLVKKAGVDPAQIVEVIGVSWDRPLSNIPPDSDLNRRVEFEVVP